MGFEEVVRVNVHKSLHRSRVKSFFLKVCSVLAGWWGIFSWSSWQKTAVCLSSSAAVRCPGTSPAQGSTPLLEGNIWYQLLSGRGSPCPLPPSFKGKEARLRQTIGLPIILQSWRRKWPWDGAGWCCVLGFSCAVLCSKTDGRLSWLNVEDYTLSYEKTGCAIWILAN